MSFTGLLNMSTKFPFDENYFKKTFLFQFKRKFRARALKLNAQKEYYYYLVRFDFSKYFDKVGLLITFYFSKSDSIIYTINA